MACCTGTTSSILADFYGPEFVLHRKKMGTLYESHPVASRVSFGTAAAISGMVKPFLAPLISAFGLLYMPIRAGIASHRGDVEGTKGYLKAWGFCALTIVGTFAFMVFTAYHMPLVWSSALVVGAVSLSIILHVRKGMKDPQ